VCIYVCVRGEGKQGEKEKLQNITATPSMIMRFFRYVLDEARRNSGTKVDETERQGS